VNRGKDSNRAEFDASIDKLRGQLGSSGGDGLAFLVEEVHSPTRERLRSDLEKAFPKLTWCVYDAGLSEEQITRLDELRRKCAIDSAIRPR